MYSQHYESSDMLNKNTWVQKSQGQSEAAVILYAMGTSMLATKSFDIS